MRSVAVLSLKGGVGKTSVVLGLAGAALQRGIRTLVVDLDPQANSTTTLEPGETHTTLADVLVDPRRSVLRAAIAASAWGECLDVLVGAEEVEAHNRPDPDAKRLTRLDQALSKLDEVADVSDQPVAPYRLVLLDCPPSLGQLTRSALVAADRALLVTEPTIYAVTGVQRAFEAVQNEREHNPDLQPLGVVVNRARLRSHEHAYRIRELREIFGPLVLPTVLPDRSAMQHAQGAGLPIQHWGTPGAQEMAVAFDALLARVLRTTQLRRRPAAEPTTADPTTADKTAADKTAADKTAADKTAA
ncbi:MAG: ParA family protein, partial [Pseudonocardiaceae bacterium]